MGYSGPKQREAIKELPAFWQHVQAEAKPIPISERLQPNQMKKGKFGLTSRTILWRNRETQHKLVAILSNHFPLEVVAESGVCDHAAIKLLMRSFASLYSLWREKACLTPTQVAQAQDHARTLVSVGLSWGGTPHHGPIGPHATVGKFL